MMDMTVREVLVMLWRTAVGLSVGVVIIFAMGLIMRWLTKKEWE